MLVSLILVSFFANVPPVHAEAKAAAKTKAAPEPAANENSPSLVKASGANSDAPTENEGFKFNTESAPPNTDRRAPMTFKDAGDAPLGTPQQSYGDSLPEETPFKAYIGYPKHQLGVYVQPMTLGSSFSRATDSYNFTNSSTAIGLDYRLQMTPLWNMEIDYSHYSMSMTGAQIGNKTFNDSTVNFDNYFFKNRFCFIGKSTFYRQLCPGFDIGNDGYPIINYIDNTHLALTRVQDIILGLNVTYQEPFSEKFVFKVTAGFNYGTGLGNSGYLTSKGDSSYYLDGGAEWSLTEHNIIQALVEYKARMAKVSGNIGNTTDTWQTNSSAFGGKLGYIRSF